VRIPAWWAVLAAAAVLVAACSDPVSGTPAPTPGPVPAAAPTTSATPTTSVTPTPEPATNVYVDPAGRFRLVPPAGWEVDTSGAQGTALILVDPVPSVTASGRLNATVTVLGVSSPADLPTTIAGARQDLQQLPEYRSTADEPVTLSDGTAAHLLGGTFRDPTSGLALRNLQIFTVHEGATIVVTGLALPELWTGFEPVFQRCLRSLTVTG
jgi:hypothetical protein